ncbi:MAG: glycosyl hydrolase family 2 [Bacteroidales bacterium]|nr:glycosyl hydrolase family 2 [Bacteroidales bacterium]
MNLRRIIFIFVVVFNVTISAQGPFDWYEPISENRPGVRWWWLGSAVDSANLTWNMEEMAAKGIGTVEITPIYGVKGNEANDIDYLSPRWMEMYGHVRAEGERFGIRIDMNNGTGWPFGGPNITTDYSACKRVMKTFDASGGSEIKEKITPEDQRQRSVAQLERVIAASDSERIDITNLVGEDTILRWTAPMGKDWTVYALFCGRTLQKVKRAAPGGEGWVVNHYDSTAVMHYLKRFDRAFSDSNVPWPESFFNDSYEVYQSDWTPAMLTEFERDHGYKLEHYLPELMSEDHGEIRSRVVRDYRYTLARLLRDNFTIPWTRWAHSHGATVRNQAHGSPANILDLYAEVDVPECESFGQTDFDLPGLAKIGPTRPSDADPAVLKFASSASHLTGKPYTSAETLTWLTQHFCTSLARCKPEIDQMFCSGVNRVLFHGAPYSPKEAAFPGWMFYASIDMSPKGGLWRDADLLFDYITDCQAFLSAGKTDTDFLLYFPIEDLWSEQEGSPYFMFEIHKMEQRMPRVKAAVREILQAGYDCDYVSDTLLQTLRVDSDGLINTLDGASYKGIIIPKIKYISSETLSLLLDFARMGSTVVMNDTLPSDVPGLGNLEGQRQQLKSLLSQLPSPANHPTVNSFGKGKIITAPTITSGLNLTGIKPETLRLHDGIQMIRRRNEAGGYNYFITLLGSEPINGYVNLAVPSTVVEIFDPLRHGNGIAQSHCTADSTTEVRLQLQPGQSLLLKTFGEAATSIQDYLSGSNQSPCGADVSGSSLKPWAYIENQGEPIIIDKGWQLSFEKSDPEISATFAIDSLRAWTDLPITEAKTNFATGIYSVDFDLPENINADDWLLDLGDVRESAEVRVNGRQAGKACFVPFTLHIGEYLQPGANHLEIRVTNLPVNRIAEYDRQGVEWRIFKDANIASVDGAKSVNFADWPTVPSGLNSQVSLIPLTLSK